MKEKVTRQEKLDHGNRILLDKNLSPAARVIGWYITVHINRKRGYAWPPQTMIANDLGISLRAVKYAVKSLAPYFNINRQGRANEYRIGAKLTPIEADNRCKKRPGKVQKTTEIGAKKYPPSFEYPLNHPLKKAEFDELGKAKGRNQVNLNGGFVAKARSRRRRNLTAEQAKKYLDDCENILASGTDAERQQLRIECPQLQLIATDDFYPAEDRDRASRLLINSSEGG